MFLVHQVTHRAEQSRAETVPETSADSAARPARLAGEPDSPPLFFRPVERRGLSALPDGPEPAALTDAAPPGWCWDGGWGPLPGAAPYPGGTTTGVGSVSQPDAEAHLPLPDPRRPYFRCHPLHATLSVGLCRANRGKLPLLEALLLPWELPSWLVQPPACADCLLARAMEAGRVPFYTAEEVLAGRALAEPVPAEPPALPPYN